eukprot:NODE_1280_length_1604_cov_22.905466_g1145_i0.p1 GENE.NODE_1280_length_1604_cov_22.905466_g1145_i0~~NODE_1280_length_1604_cov_22.905466_g1145_i0.p1  ORF type:complete len:370 (-),score=44.44 NODE_1280_length_1604_cov_22.905466_g1145_i0:288-1397(-)
MVAWSSFACYMALTVHHAHVTFPNRPRAYATLLTALSGVWDGSTLLVPLIGMFLSLPQLSFATLYALYGLMAGVPCLLAFVYLFPRTLHTDGDSDGDHCGAAVHSRGLSFWILLKQTGRSARVLPKMPLFGVATLKSTMATVVGYVFLDNAAVFARYRGAKSTAEEDNVLVQVTLITGGVAFASIFASVFTSVVQPRTAVFVITVFSAFLMVLSPWTFFMWLDPVESTVPLLYWGYACVLFWRLFNYTVSELLLLAILMVDHPELGGSMYGLSCSVAGLLSGWIGNMLTQCLNDSESTVPGVAVGLCAASLAVELLTICAVFWRPGAGAASSDAVVEEAERNEELRPLLESSEKRERLVFRSHSGRIVH